MTCLSIFVDLQEKQEKETLATSNRMSDEHGNEPSGNWDNLRNWGLTVVANYMQQELEKDPLDNSSC